MPRSGKRGLTIKYGKWQEWTLYVLLGRKTNMPSDVYSESSQQFCWPSSLCPPCPRTILSHAFLNALEDYQNWVFGSLIKTVVLLPLHFKLFGLAENYWDRMKSLLLGSAVWAPNHLPSSRRTVADARPQWTGSANHRVTSWVPTLAQQPTCHDVPQCLFCVRLPLFHLLVKEKTFTIKKNVYNSASLPQDSPCIINAELHSFPFLLAHAILIHIPFPDCFCCSLYLARVPFKVHINVF